MYDTQIVVRQHQWYGPFPISYKKIANENTQKAILGIKSVVLSEKLKPFKFIGEKEICDVDKRFVLKMMKLDPRDTPTARELSEDEELVGDGGVVLERGVGYRECDVHSRDFSEMIRASRSLIIGVLFMQQWLPCRKCGCFLPIVVLIFMTNC